MIFFCFITTFSGNISSNDVDHIHVQNKKNLRFDLLWSDTYDPWLRSRAVIFICLYNVFCIASAHTCMQSSEQLVVEFWVSSCQILRLTGKLTLFDQNGLFFINLHTSICGLSVQNAHKKIQLYILQLLSKWCRHY